MEKKKIWVVGHKHPDTDSICAAIAYANLKTVWEKRIPNIRLQRNMSQSVQEV